MADSVPLRGLDLPILADAEWRDFKISPYSHPADGFLRMLDFCHTLKPQQRFESGIGDAHE